MLVALLRMTAVIVAFMAAWLVMGSAAQAHPSSMSDVANPVTVHSIDDPAPDASVRGSEAQHRHHASTKGDGDDHCPTGSACCDALCHAVVLGTEQEVASVEARYAPYSTIPDVTVISRSADGLDRPPRPAFI